MTDSYRNSDGKPASYSATGIGKKTGEGNSAAPTAAFPTDDGAAHFGILSAGAANGSVVAMQGTSFASAQATRFIAMGYMQDSYSNYKSHKQYLYLSAKVMNKKDYNSRQNKNPPYYRSHTDPETTGGGRLDSPLNPRVNRTGYEIS